jgi:hypothetical protein
MSVATSPNETKNKSSENIEQPKVSTTVPTQNPAAVVVETEADKNWKEFRKGREEDRKRREDAERRASEKEAEAIALKQALEAIVNKPSSSTPSSPGMEMQDEDDDSRIKRIVAQAIGDTEKKYAERQRIQEAKDLPHKLVSSFSDFNSVCTTENLDYLDFHHPEVSNAFKERPESFNKWADIYKYIKKSIPNPDSRKEEKKIEKNLGKPQSMSIPGVTNSGDSAPRKLDDKMRADNWARMLRVMKGVA